jgi:hypothetical protein
MPQAGAVGIRNDKVLKYLSKFKADKNSVTLTEYLDTYKNWITASKNNSIVGLDEYNSMSFIHGTVQAFDHFYIQHYQRRFRFARGEFMYHKASMKTRIDWAWLEDDVIHSNDAVIISTPFSDTGCVHENLQSILNRCEELSVPVLLDLAYLPIAKNVNIDVRYKCIDTICTSISKMFDGAQYLRTGIRLQRNNLDDGINIFNSVNMVPNYNMSMAVHIMSKYSIDFNWNTYEKVYHQVCQELNLSTTDCVLFGTSLTEYKAFNRGNNHNRVCISNEISNYINREHNEPEPN